MISLLFLSRYKRSSYKLFREPDIIKFLKIQRMKGAGHIIRMKDDRTTKRILLARPIDDRKRGRPRLRWADCLQRDFNTIRVKD